MKKRIMAFIMAVVLLCGTVFVFGASDPAVTIVSPSETVYGSNLLVSVKITAPKTIKVYVYEEKQKVGDTLVSIDPSVAGNEDISLKTIVSVSVMTPETYKSTSNLQFYNKQFNEINPGLYRIKVETLDSAGTAIASTTKRIAVMSQDAENATGSAIFQSQESGALQWVQNFLKSIFGN